MTDNCCASCRKAAEPINAKNCLAINCELSLILSGPERFRRKFRAELDEWLTPDRLYHAFTGEDDDYELARISRLDHVLQSSLLEKAKREWPARLRQLDQACLKEALESKRAVQQFILGIEP